MQLEINWPWSDPSPNIRHICAITFDITVFHKKIFPEPLFSFDRISIIFMAVSKGSCPACKTVDEQRITLVSRTYWNLELVATWLHLMEMVSQAETSMGADFRRYRNTFNKGPAATALVLTLQTVSN